MRGTLKTSIGLISRCPCAPTSDISYIPCSLPLFYSLSQSLALSRSHVFDFGRASAAYLSVFGLGEYVFILFGVRCLGFRYACHLSRGRYRPRSVVIDFSSMCRCSFPLFPCYYGYGTETLVVRDYEPGIQSGGGPEDDHELFSLIGIFSVSPTT